MYALCNDEKSVLDAISIIKAVPYILFDCEGQILGHVGGQLSLISIATPNAGSIFLIDVVNMKEEVLQPLFDILAGSDVMKVVWSGRMDYSELFFGHGVELRNVLDLQIVDIFSRSLRFGDSQILRLAKAGGVQVKDIDNFPIEGIHDLRGMDKAISEHMISPGLAIPKSAFVTAMHKNNQSAKWMERPIIPELAKYAANDIRSITHIYDHFLEMGYVTYPPTNSLMDQSIRFVSIHRDLGRPQKGDKFRGSGFLPLGILESPVSTPKQSCDKCQRVLNTSMFPFTSDPAHGNGRPRKLAPQCRLCFFLLHIDQLREERYYARNNAFSRYLARLDIS